MLPVSPVSALRLALRHAPVSRFGAIAAHRVQTPGNGADSRVPLPPSTLFLGVAEDGLPVLLNLGASSSGPLVVAADAGAGKTRLLRTLARAIELMHDPNCTRFAVITEHPEEWPGLEASTHCEGVLPFHHAFATDYLHRAASRRSGLPGRVPSLILLIDGFEALAADGDLRGAAHSLLHSPVSSGAIPIVTLNTSATCIPVAWLECFPLRILGHIRERDAAARLQPSAELFSRNLQPPCQFASYGAGSWLPFWLPELE